MLLSRRQRQQGRGKLLHPNHSHTDQFAVPPIRRMKQSWACSKIMMSRLALLVIGIGILTVVTVPLRHHVVSTPRNIQMSSVVDVAIDVNIEDIHDGSHKKKKEKVASAPVELWEVMPAKDADASISTELKPATIICTCAKCGSTSLWMELFAIVHGRSFESMNYTGPPWIHNLSNKKLWTNIEAVRKTDWSSSTKTQNSFALIRDPKERILSAWKSKVSCVRDKAFDNAVGQTRIVAGLLKLAGSSNDITARTDLGFPCLDFSDYLTVLAQIHAQGKEELLDGHFRPQQLGCFKDVPPSMWTVVTTIGGPTALCSLKSVLSKNASTFEKTDDDCRMVKSHNYTRRVNLTGEDEVILDKITRREYEVLGQYLPSAN